MADQKLTIAARILVKEGKVDLVKAELLKLIDITRAEEGCINYDLHQDNNNKNLFLFYEKWETYDFLQKHLNNIHFVAFQKATEGAIEEFVVNEMTQIA
ncbi:putative quinol monooxygenase [Labilibaculum antarcticum]|uniref:Antibiotic biosynthesis monooxygenase n=1 Tax=Labilibaculum antarcticum TaxID=1717717 RepID=A0A1Y1CQE7_9BACT|nr:putative quinol monooxygenase [Labilibaculum antarcticum]BAX82484.1 antibiotic biosynthesis monooxygenase [Labilibaculum antarcticum]